jgi:phosphocarrier protein
LAIVERRVKIVNRNGLHARPAAEFVKLTGRFTAEITVTNGDMSVNGKSIMGVMTLAAECGTVLTVRASGDDAEAAIVAVEDLVARGFQEK